MAKKAKLTPQESGVVLAYVTSLAVWTLPTAAAR
jgi:hypothetical protein